ncbi:DJ-1/PfpI family protein [Campylobacter gastrosuis]|uniref:DJ-1/PfpI family protein n=1 Tax=Campylobacter gastrosuis TaxID=2974576 RepID=A0ABT7HLQ6_9BACT|nr:DJ-1/PfpI family protein [Campylobacter gastrosuis]MDL0087907.1 DJ-1/PfpI family protein [Campylobacter gastrosuis]
MNVAVVMYDRINLINFANVLGFIKSFENANVKTCGFKSEVVDEFGIKMHPEIYGEGIYGADILVVPDGVGALNLRHDEIFLSWIKSGSSTKTKIGFDLGSLILAGAGFLQGKKATIRGGYKNALSEYCEICGEKVCQSGDIISVSEWGDEIKSKLAQILA